MEKKTTAIGQPKQEIAVMPQNVQQQRLTAEGTEIDLVELFFYLLSHWKMLLMALLIGAALAGVFHDLTASASYEATTDMYITNTDSIVSLAELNISSALTEDYQVIIGSRQVLNKVISDLGLNTDYRELAKKIRIENPSGTHIIRTHVTTDNPELSRDIANDLLLVSIDSIYQILGNGEPSVIEYSEAEAISIIASSIRKTMAIGAVLGFLLVAAVLVIQMLMDNTLKNQDDVEKYLHLSVLTAVPYYKE